VGHNLAGYKAALGHQARRYWQRKESKDLRIERRADSAIRAIGT
jgi:hypothetical protein